MMQKIIFLRKEIKFSFLIQQKIKKERLIIQGLLLMLI